MAVKDWDEQEIFNFFLLRFWENPVKLNGYSAFELRVQNQDLTTEELKRTIIVKLLFKATFVRCDIETSFQSSEIYVTHRWKLDIKSKKASGIGMRVVLRR